jgi:parallel beta-helix repeat protein
MEFIGSENNSIIKNTFQNNEAYGIVLNTDSNFNRIFKNTLINNVQGCIMDSSTGNIYYNNKCSDDPGLDLAGIMLLFIRMFLILNIIFYVYLGFSSLEKYLSRRKKDKKSMDKKDTGKAVEGLKQLMGFFDLLNDHVMDSYKEGRKSIEREYFFELLDKSGLDAKKIKLLEGELNG